MASIDMNGHGKYVVLLHKDYVSITKMFLQYEYEQGGILKILHTEPLERYQNDPPHAAWELIATVDSLTDAMQYTKKVERDILEKLVPKEKQRKRTEREKHPSSLPDLIGSYNSYKDIMTPTERVLALEHILGIDK